MCARDDEEDGFGLSTRDSTRAHSTTDLTHPAAQVRSASEHPVVTAIMQLVRAICNLQSLTAGRRDKVANMP